jgi:hypothetical protein
MGSLIRRLPIPDVLPELSKISESVRALLRYLQSPDVAVESPIILAIIRRLTELRAPHVWSIRIYDFALQGS